MRVGFSIRVYGYPDLPSHDGRHASEGAHLSMSLAYLRDILLYLQANQIHMYRLHTELIPNMAHRTLEELKAEIDDCSVELAEVGGLARRADVRLSFHPYSTVILNAANEDQAAWAATCLAAQAMLLDALGQGPEAVIVLHVGGVYDNKPASLERFVRRYEALLPSVQRRLALENDDHRFSYADVYAIYARCGLPLVLDNLHHLVLNPEGIPLRDALLQALATWPDDVTPKIHFSTPCTEMTLMEGSSRVKVPTWTEHSDFCDPFVFIDLLHMAQGLRSFDVMLEAKARDLALLKLREDVRRFAPVLAKAIC